MKPTLNDQIWVWGGPTANWGGTMAEDCLARGAEFFGTRNVVYVYGPHNDRSLALLESFDNVVCQIGANCRNPEAVPEDTVAEAERLSALSLRYPNIAGAIIDDFDTGHEAFPAAKMHALRDALRSHNPTLKLHVVVYTEKQHEGYEDVLPYVDVVTMWVWKRRDLPALDTGLETIRREFPGKPVYMGVFLHDYGETKEAMPLERLTYQLDRGREHLAAGLLNGIIILGVREISKHPEQSAFVRDYLARYFAVDR